MKIRTINCIEIHGFQPASHIPPRYECRHGGKLLQEFNGFGKLEAAEKWCRKTTDFTKKLKKSVREFEISFCVSGYTTQFVTITDPKLTAAKLEKLLNEGKVVTTIQEGGQVYFVRSGKVVGHVTMVDNECEYNDFTVEDNDE